MALMKSTSNPKNLFLVLVFCHALQYGWLMLRLPLHPNPWAFRGPLIWNFCGFSEPDRYSTDDGFSSHKLRTKTILKLQIALSAQASSVYKDWIEILKAKRDSNYLSDWNRIIAARLLLLRHSDFFCYAYSNVTILVAVEGAHNLPKIKSTDDVKKALNSLRDICCSEKTIRSSKWSSRNTNGVEVFLTPRDKTGSLSEEELLANYKHLRPIKEIDRSCKASFASKIPTSLDCFRWWLSTLNRDGARGWRKSSKAPLIA